MFIEADHGLSMEDKVWFIGGLEASTQWMRHCYTWILCSCLGEREEMRLHGISLPHKWSDESLLIDGGDVKWHHRSMVKEVNFLTKRKAPILIPLREHFYPQEFNFGFQFVNWIFINVFKFRSDRLNYQLIYFR